MAGSGFISESLLKLVEDEHVNAKLKFQKNLLQRTVHCSFEQKTTLKFTSKFNQKKTADSRVESARKITRYRYYFQLSIHHIDVFRFTPFVNSFTQIFNFLIFLYFLVSIRNLEFSTQTLRSMIFYFIIFSYDPIENRSLKSNEIRPR